VATVLQSYVIGVDEISAEDIYNLREDEDSVVGIADVSYVEVFETDNELFRVTGGDYIVAAEDADYLNSGTVETAGLISASVVSSIYGIAEGTAVVSWTYAINGYIPSITESIAADTYDGGDAAGSIVLGEMKRIGLNRTGTSTGEGIVRTFKEDFIDPDNPDGLLVVGYAQLRDAVPGNRDTFSGVDAATVVGAADIAAPVEGAIKTISSDIYGSSESGSPATGSTFALDDSPLDDPAMTLDAKFVLNTDTVDGGTYQIDPPGGAPYQLIPNLLTLNDNGFVLGVTEILASVQHYGEVIGVAEVLDVQSEGYSTGEPYNANGLVVGSARISSRSSVIQIAGASNGGTLVTEGLSDFILNAPEGSTLPDVAFRYSISAIEEYTFVPALAGSANGVTSIASNLTVQYAMSGESDGLSIVVGRSLEPGSLYDGGGSPAGYYGPTGPTGPPGEYT
jgi:hypothetical protein